MQFIFLPCVRACGQALVLALVAHPTVGFFNLAHEIEVTGVDLCPRHELMHLLGEIKAAKPELSVGARNIVPVADGSDLSAISNVKDDACLPT